MKRRFLPEATGALALLIFAAGCAGVISPGPVADTNAKPVPEPISYYGDIELFDEKMTPLIVRVDVSNQCEEPAFAETLKECLNKSDVQCALPGKPCDIRVTLGSSFQELTPAPQCRMNHLTSISVAAADGTVLLPVWEHKTEMHQACSKIPEAKAKLFPQIRKSISEWEKKYFRRSVTDKLKVSIVRFRMSRKLIELGSVRYKSDLRKVLNQLRRINGVVEVRLIETDEESRITSFRVLYRNDILLKNKIRKQK